MKNLWLSFCVGLYKNDAEEMPKLIIRKEVKMMKKKTKKNTCISFINNDVISIAS